MMILINNYSINVGTSTTEEKTLLIKTLLNFDVCINNCQVYPYGSSRIRYETRKTFDITIKEMNRNIIGNFNDKNYSDDDLDTYKFYEIKIKKNNKEIAKGANAKLFGNGGWNFNLRLWFPLRKKINISNIVASIPYKYGELCAQFYDDTSLYTDINTLVTNKNRFKYGLIVPFYNRAEYVKTFLKSLRNTNLSDTVILFMDESLSENQNENININTEEGKEIIRDRKEVNELINEFKLNINDMNNNTNNTFLLKIYKKQHGNMFDSILIGMDLLYCFCDYLMTIDSDTIQKENWMNAINKSYEHAHNDFKTDILLCSGFNVVSERHRIIEKKSKYILKNSVGGCNMFFSCNIYIYIIRKCLMSHKWDTNIVNHIQKLNGKIITTNPSVVQHIGRNTSINRKDKEIFDEALDF